MADDRVLIDATNEAFWQITGYKTGQRLDMSLPQDRSMAKSWLDIYRELRGHRDRATQAAQRTLNETVTPYVLVVERKSGILQPQAFPGRNQLEVQYAWVVDQPEDWAYVAAFDFTRRRDAPLYDQFALTVRRREATSGWYAW
ncbi:MAG TPA: hypothetical protein VLE97_07110 [Gaiellaceae bacterium]|nr:hypothetical protein [Gaiellaceae bacterium]